MISYIYDRKVLVPALIGAGVSIFLAISGLFSLLFLVPLGFLAYRYDYRTAWTGFAFIVIGNILLNFGILNRDISNFLFYIAMAGIFTWIVSPPPASNQVPMSIRLSFGSCLGALLLIFIMGRVISTPFFLDYMDSMLNNFLLSNTGANVVQNALLQSITVEEILDAIMSIMVRGGSLISCILLFTLCRQLGYFLARIILRRKKIDISPSSLVQFHASSILIWVLSISLLLLVLSRLINFKLIEIILWNILILCVILYLAQGIGILQFFLSKPSTPPFMGILFMILFVFLIVSPVLNLVLLVGLTILGITENWVPFRAPKINGPPTTPQA
ncbi:MAG: DUF2232 domain-containing protein [Treponema sp.]|nr:DUF2232 domain-containing protein [Treponema sp.]